MEKPDRPAAGLLAGPPRAVNVGLEWFYRSLLSQGAKAVHVAWRPPAGGDPKIVSLLDRLSGRRAKE
jgi:FdrA protein